MRCPKCSRAGFHVYTTCGQCGFSGPPDLIEEVGHVAYLLGELDTWGEIQATARESIRSRYLDRREELETVLGLHPPPLTPEQVHELQWELFCLGALRQEVSQWVAQGWVRPWPADRLQQGAQKRIAVLQERLKEAPALPPFEGVEHRLRLLDYLQGMLELADRRGHFSSDAACVAAQASLHARRDELEIEAGRRPRLAKAAVAAAVTPVAPAAEPVPAAEAPVRPSKPPKPPRQPITWDRIWQTLLSERTLNVLLFLGAFLMVASATTYIVYNWEALPPAVQLGAIVLFTLSFYGAGWFLRVRMKLRASGIAVTAIGSLLMPLDFYAVGVVGGVVPMDKWPWVWLIASAVCLPVYTLTTLRIQAHFLGYLVVAAAGSLLSAILWVTAVPPEWLLAALVALALGLLALAYRLQALSSPSTWRILDAPLRFSALIGAAAILPLGIGWWLASGVRGVHFDASLAVAWMLAAVLYTCAAIHEQSPWLGRVVASIVPGALLLVLRLAFEPLAIEVPWYGLALAALAPLYLWVGYRFHRRASFASAGPQPQSGTGMEAAILRTHGRTATGWGLGLAALAAAWSVFDLWAAAATHALLALVLALLIYLWQRPRALPVVSLLALSSITFGMVAAHLDLAELGVGWALLAALHVLAALRFRTTPAVAARLFASALALSGLALLPPLISADEGLLTYVLGQWVALATWLLWLDHTGRHPGLARLLGRLGPLRGSALHWAAALPLPFFAAMVYTRCRASDAWLGFLLALLAWALFAVGQLRRLTTTSVVFRPMPGARSHPLLRHWSLPWYLVAYSCSLAGPALAFYFYDQVLWAVTLLLASALYFVSVLAFHARGWLVPAGLALPLGLLILLDSWAVPWPQQGALLAGVVAAYLLGGVGLERGHPLARRFLAPLYVVAHVVALASLLWGLAPAVDAVVNSLPWPDPARLWAAGGQLVLALVYTLFAWFHAREHWAHLASWLGVLVAGLVVTVLSQGRGSAVLQAALVAVLYILAERLLAAERLQDRWHGLSQAWSLYRRPLLVAGWAVSAATIGLALLHNLLILGGGRLQTAWAIAGLLTVTALYAASAWMFRRRLFVWLAGVLFILPWTLLAVWGWFIWPAPPPLTRHALSWAILACLQLGLGLVLTFRASPRSRSLDNGFPLRIIANGLLLVALFWAVADSATSSLTWGMGLIFYAVSAAADHRRGLFGWRVSRFLYPSVVVLSVWVIYLANRAWPSALYETYGLLFLALALPLLALGRILCRIEPTDGLPFILGSYGVVIVGTVLVAHQPALFAIALLFDSLLCVLSAWIFRQSLWVYPATALVSAALLIALAQSQAVPLERRGWWLIGLGAVCLAWSWLLQRAGQRRARLQSYAIPPLVAAFAITVLGLALSSLDQTGAFWGYLAVALLYAAVAFWLWQPLLLGPAAALLAVPYGVGLVWLEVNPPYYGLALFPGVSAALAVAHLLERWLGRPGPILVGRHPRSWRLRALLDWWAAPFFAWGYGGAVVAIGLSLGLRSGQASADSIRLAVTLALAAVTFVHATWRFRSRAYLLLAGTLAQAAALALIDAAGWLAHPAWAALAFLPVTLVTAALAIALQLWRREGSPLGATWWPGWSRPFYWLLALDLLAGQVAALFHSNPGAVVTLAHALLLAFLATLWIQPILALASVVLGALGTTQAMARAGLDLVAYPVGMALLALTYGLAGYGMASVRRQAPRIRIWLRPLEWTALGLSATALIAVAGIGFDVGELLARAVLGRTLTFADYAPQVRMVMWVLALCGLLYLATAAVHRWLVLGYGAVALLLVAWGMWWRFFIDMASVQWYAVPAGLYLLGLGWLEWRQGRRTLSRWIDRAGTLVLLGTAWWQSLPGVMDNGWPYALLMGTESLLLVWWGSARRQRQFLYIGALSLIVNVITQSIEPLLSANRWIVFGLAGLLLVGIAVLVERKLEAIRQLSVEMRTRLEGWE